MNFTDEIRYRIASKWAQNGEGFPVAEAGQTLNYRLAAVMMPLVFFDRDWHLLFIRRTVTPDDFHGGQVAFPGGTMEIVDRNLVDTALREASEELGIDARFITLLGSLSRVLTISNFLVTPVVAKLEWHLSISPSSAEVARVFTIPIPWLMNSSNYTVDWRTADGNDPVEVIQYREYQGEILWGASAKFVSTLLEILPDY